MSSRTSAAGTPDPIARAAYTGAFPVGGGPFSF
jgi:hypothetical protein